MLHGQLEKVCIDSIFLLTHVQIALSQQLTNFVLGNPRLSISKSILDDKETETLAFYIYIFFAYWLYFKSILNPSFSSVPNLLVVNRWHWTSLWHLKRVWQQMEGKRLTKVLKNSGKSSGLYTITLFYIWFVIYTGRYWRKVF